MTNQQEDEQDPEGLNKRYDELKNFYQKYTENLVVFDPLDRPIPDEDNDQALKRDDFVKKLNEMPAILGFALNAPMSKERYNLLEKMFESEVQACIDIGQHYLEKAQQDGLDFKEDINQHSKIISI